MLLHVACYDPLSGQAANKKVSPTASQGGARRFDNVRLGAGGAGIKSESGRWTLVIVEPRDLLGKDGFRR